MNVEFVISVDDAINSVNKRLPKRKYSSFNGEFLNDLNEISSKTILSGASEAEIQKELTAVFNDYEDNYKRRMKLRLEKDSGLPYEAFSADRAYPSPGSPTINGQVNKTWLVSKRDMRNSVIKNKKRYDKAVSHLTTERRDYLRKMGIKGRTDEELLRNIAKDITNRLGTALGGNMNNREESLRLTNQTRVKYLSDVETLKGVTVQYMLGDRERHCPECIALAGSIYNDISNAPPLPRHTRCGCFYEKYKLR